VLLWGRAGARPARAAPPPARQGPGEPARDDAHLGRFRAGRERPLVARSWSWGPGCRKPSPMRAARGRAGSPRALGLAMRPRARAGCGCAWGGCWSAFCPYLSVARTAGAGVQCAAGLGPGMQAGADDAWETHAKSAAIRPRPTAPPPPQRVARRTRRVGQRGSGPGCRAGAAPGSRRWRAHVGTAGPASAQQERRPQAAPRRYRGKAGLASLAVLQGAAAPRQPAPQQPPAGAVEHYALPPAAARLASCCHHRPRPCSTAAAAARPPLRITWRYSSRMAAGVTPGRRCACAMLAGRASASFSRSSFDSWPIPQ
jgi:hypothetical protein